MNAMLACLVIFVSAGFSFGGPLSMFSYHTQSIVFGTALTVYALLRHPHARLLGKAMPTPSVNDGDLFGSILKEIDDLDISHLFDNGVTEPDTSTGIAQTTVKQRVRSAGSATGESVVDAYTKEAEVINGQLEKLYELNAKIKPGDISRSWNYVTYPLTQCGALRFADVQRIEVDLGRDISARHRSRMGNNERVEVLAVDAHPKILLQVTRANPQPLLWGEQPRSVKVMNTVIGFYLDGTQAKPLTIDMAGDDSEHINGGFFGQPGSGKSSTLISALDILLGCTPPSMLEVYGIDLKKNNFKRYHNTQHMSDYTSSAEHALSILDQFVVWCNEKTAPTDLKYRLLVIDEFQMLINHSEYGKAALDKITTIMQAGREWGIRVWTATQNPNADNYPSSLKPLTHFMGCGHIQNDDYVRRQLQIYGASKITPKREMIFVDAFGDRRITTFWYSPEDRIRTLEVLNNTWVNNQQTERHAPPVLDPDNVRFPVSSHRPLSPVEREAAVNLRRNRGYTLTDLCIHVYGSKNSKTLNLIKESVNE